MCKPWASDVGFDRACIALQDADLEAPLGGVECGDEIAWAMDLHRAGRNDRALKHFLDDLRQELAEVARSREAPCAP